MAGPGPQGYPDYQKVDNWDGPLIYESLEALRKGKLETPIFSTSRYAGLECFLNTNAQPVTVFVESFADQAGLLNMGIRRFVIDPRMGGGGLLILPCNAPWTRLTFQAATEEVEYGTQFRIFGSNRQQSLLWLPQRPVIIRSVLAFAGAEAKEVFPNGYYAGPMSVAVNREPATINIQVESSYEAGAFAITEFVQSTGTVTIASFHLLAPMGAWRLGVVASGAGNATITAVPSMTGST